MNFQIIKSFSVFIFAMTLLTAGIFAQDQNSTIVYDNEGTKMPVAMQNNLYCAGYVQSSEINTRREVVGAEDEKDKHVFSQGDALYVNAGAGSGVQVGDMYSVIRPRGKVKTDWSRKDNLGIFVQEVGMVEIIRVMGEVSVARVKTSCSVILMGDLLTPIPQRVSPMFQKRPPLDVFKAASGKASGRIFMSRDSAELLGREQIVYIDLGREDNVQIGDYATIYRPLGTGNIYSKVLKETVDARKPEFESDRYEGGWFSNQTARKKGSNASGKVVTTEDAKSRRPDSLRRVVGELIILNVLEKTATAMIVRNASEIHTGDYVELQ